MSIVSYLVLDIETIPDPELTPKDPEKFPAAPHHQIAMIGVLLLDGQTLETKRLGFIGGGSTKYQLLPESHQLVAFSEYMGRSNPTLVSYNGRRFDLPVMVARCLKHRIPLAWYWNHRDMRYRYSESGHFDLMDFLSDHGAAINYGLDVAAKLCGWPGKMPLVGYAENSEPSIEDCIRRGDIEQIARYNLVDVVLTAGVFLNLLLVRGQLSRDGYQGALTSLLQVAEKHPLLAQWVQTIDLKRIT